MLRLEKPKDNFTIVCNELLRDKRLSLRAKGLYALMFSKPHDWVFYEGALVEESAEGRDAVRAAMRELADAGWLTKHQPRENGGLLAHSVIRLHITADWKSGDGSTGDGKSAPIKTDNIKTKEVSPPTPKGEPDGFEEIWKARWGRGKASQPRQPAQRAFSAALKKGAKPADILAGVKARVGVDKPDTEYAPMLATWLNQERWKDGSGAAVLSADDLEAARKRQEASAEAHKARMQALVEERSNALLKRA